MIRDLYHGHVLEVLAQLPEASVDMVVTSPPYWGLRKYSGEQELTWGGKPDCEHGWGEEIMNREEAGWHRLKGPMAWEGAKVTQRSSSQGSFCLHCGAWRGSFGLEPTIELYMAHTLEILRAIRRVLKPWGTVWWNLGDSYAGFHGNKRVGDMDAPSNKPGYIENMRETTVGNGLKPLDLCLIPERFALAAQEDGWYIRSRIVWAKSNPMPESIRGFRWERCKVKVKGAFDDWRERAREKGGPVGNDAVSHQSGGQLGLERETEWADCPGCPKCLPNDGYVIRKGSWRPTEATDTIWMLAANKEYFADGEGVREPSTTGDNRRPYTSKGAWELDGRPEGQRHGGEQRDGDGSGRNLRNVWTFATQPFPGAHFAVFPERLPELCILAGSPEKVCSQCGRPWVRMVERKSTTAHNGETASSYPEGTTAKRLALLRQAAREQGQEYSPSVETLGFRPSCSCNAEPKPAVILDPFVGSGTTPVVARRLGRHWLGIDLSLDYLCLAADRIINPKTARKRSRSKDNGHEADQMLAKSDYSPETELIRP